MQADLFLGDLEDPAVGEYVPTPRWVVQALLETPGVCVPRGGRRLRVLDACAGLGQIGVAYEALCTQPPQITAVDAHDARLARCPKHWTREAAGIFEWCERAKEAGRIFDLVLCNPPFSMYFEIVEALLSVRHPVDGQVWVLGPWEYLARQSQEAWWERCRPEWVLPLRRRPWKDTREIAWVGWMPRTEVTRMRWAGRA